MKFDLKGFRLRRGLSQEALADAFGYGQTMMSRVETRKKNVSIAKLEEAAQRLGVDISEFFEHERPTPSAEPSPPMPPAYPLVVDRVRVAPMNDEGVQSHAVLELTVDGKVYLFGLDAAWTAYAAKALDQRLSSLEPIARVVDR